MGLRGGVGGIAALHLWITELWPPLTETESWFIQVLCLLSAGYSMFVQLTFVFMYSSFNIFLSRYYPLFNVMGDWGTPIKKRFIIISVKLLLVKQIWLGCRSVVQTPPLETSEPKTKHDQSLIPFTVVDSSLWASSNRLMSKWVHTDQILTSAGAITRNSGSDQILKIMQWTVILVLE